MNVYTEIAALSAEDRRVLELLLREDGPGADVMLPRERGAATFPLSFAQQRLWFLDQFQPGSPFYNIPTALRLRGTLDVAALERGLSDVVRRHETLRTRFTVVDGEPRQVIDPASPLGLPLIDLSASDAQEREAEALRRAREAARQPFDLAAGPVLRAMLLRLDRREHLLVLVVHHVAADAWSLGVLLREIAELYAAHATGRPARLPELPLQYADFALWQRERLDAGARERQLAYWRRNLAGAPPLIELRGDRPRPAAQSFRGASVPCDVPAATAAAVQALSQAERVTPFMTLLAAFQALLMRVTGQTDVLVGSPVANRGRAEVEHLIGFFANTLVLRTDVSGAPTFRALLGRVRDVAVAAYAHQDLPFEQLVEDLQPRRTLSHSPLFQVAFALQNAPAEALSLPGLEMEPVEADAGTTQFDLTLRMWQTRRGYAGRLEYGADLFDERTAARLARQFVRLLGAATEAPDRPVTRLPLLDDDETRRFLALARGPSPAYPTGTLAQVFEGVAARAGERVALQAEGCPDVTYAQLDRRAEVIARRLRARGVRAGDVVGLLGRRSPELIAATLGVLKAGAVYLPLDPESPAPRRRQMLSETRAALLLCEQAAADSPCPVLALDAGGEGAAEADLPARMSASGDAPAYVCYTSGSTGRPKGVLVTQRGVLRLVFGDERLQLGPEQVLLHLAPFAFDASTFEIWGALLHGARLVLHGERVPTAEGLRRTIARHGVTSVWLTTSLFHALVDETPDALQGARHLVVGGEVLSPAHLRAARQALPELRVVNAYGPTEATTFSTLHALPGEPSDECAAVPIGRALANSTAYVLDGEMQPVPAGVTGELYVGGDGLALGYVAQPRASAERFVPDPFGDAGGRLYRTGDLVFARPDGTLEFVGRRDAQVKIRGFRVEPGEIEHALAEHPNVRECVVLWRPEGSAPAALVACVAPRREPAPELRELRRFLAGSLPEYMLPAGLLTFEALPRTASQKIDRQALAQAARGQAETGAEEAAAEPPRTPTEQLLAAIWRETLRVEHLSREDDFFERGGHSLLAAQVVARVRAACGVELQVRVLFESPTLAELALAVDAARRAQPGGEALPLEPLAPGEERPVSFAQQRLWFLEQLDPGGAAYVVPAAVRLRGRLDPAALARSLNDVLARHEALRTVFDTADGRPKARVLEPVTLDLPLVDLTGLPAEEREAVARARAGEQGRRGFDLSRGPLLRAELLRLGDGEHLLLLALHHVAADGWSVGVLLSELTEGYAAHAQGLPSPLQPPPVQYADFAAWQRAWLSGRRLERQLAYWRARLAGAEPALALPCDHPRPARRSLRGARVNVRLSRELSDGLSALARAHGATLFMTLLAAFQALLSRWSGQADVSVGSPVAGRVRREVEGLIGCFVNTLVLRADLSGNPRFRELLARTRASTLDAYAHQDVPFERLVEEFQPERGPGQAPLFQVMFVLQNAPRPLTAGPAELVLEQVEIDGGTTKFDLTLGLAETAQGLVGAIEYATDLFTAATVERFARHFERLLAAVVADPEWRLLDLPLNSEEERRALLDAGRGITPDYPRRPVHELFEEWAARAPEAPAVECGDARLTYGELNRRANRLARHLARRGVGPDVVVGVLMDRSPELLVALLGILKAGGAYLPLDPLYPEERLRFMVDDARVPLLLTHGALGAALGDDGRLLRLDADWPAVESESEADPRRRVHLDHLCYMTFTSGSTGRPKGVAVPHRGVLRLLFGLDWARLGRDECFLQLGPLPFDVSTFELWGGLLHGARLALFPGRMATPHELEQALRRHGVTTLWLTSALFNTIVDEHPQALRGLRQLLVGGEALSLAHVRRALRELPETTLINGYGPTENTTFTTCHTLPRALPEGLSSVPIGRPVANTHVVLLDERLEPVPVGIAGELYTGGDGVVRGYNRRPGLTAEKFVPDPFREGARLYRTGDLARWLPDGTIEFLGRRDHQVKVRGFRIELGEIEAVLGAHEAVKETVVVARAGAAGARLVAYVVLRPEAAAGLDELRRHLRAKLPEYMVPSALVALPRIPLTPNLKVDRAALPAPEDTAERGPAVAPRSEIERALCELCGELLGREVRSVHDDFFELGGHSLLASQLVSRASRRFEVELPLRAVFEAKCVAALAEQVELLLWARDGRAAVSGELADGLEEAAL